MTNIKERIEPVFSAVLKAIYAQKADNHRLELTQLPEPYKGWIDGFEQIELLEPYQAQVRSRRDIKSSFANKYYYIIFDLENIAGKQLKKKFWESSTDGVLYDFNPTSSFRVKGSLHEHGVINNLEWAVLATIE